MKNLSANILDIKFYLYDEEGNEVLNEKGKVKEFRIKDKVRFKPLEYLCEDFDIDILEEIKDDQGQYWKDYDNRIKMSGDNPIGENDS